MRGLGHRLITLAFAASLAACAPAGTHYGSWLEGPTAALTPQPNDPCQRPEIRSPGMLTFLNAKIGQRGGPSGRVVAVEEAFGGTQFPGSEGISLNCRARLKLENGQSELGTLHIQEKGGNGTPIVSFEYDPAQYHAVDAGDPLQSVSQPIAGRSVTGPRSTWADIFIHSPCAGGSKFTHDRQAIAECDHVLSYYPPCDNYQGFALIWYELANQPDHPKLEWIDETIDLLNLSVENRQKLHRLARVMFSTKRSTWSTSDEASSYARRICTEGHPF